MVVVAVSMLVTATIAVFSLDDDHSYDMTYMGAEATVNGAILQAFTPDDSTGTGYWHSILRVSSNQTVVQGWNSDYARAVEFQEDASWTSSDRKSVV